MHGQEVIDILLSVWETVPYNSISSLIDLAMIRCGCNSPRTSDAEHAVPSGHALLLA